MDMKDVVKILLRLHEQGFSKEVIFFYCFDGKYKTANLTGCDVNFCWMILIQKFEESSPPPLCLG